MHRRSEATPLNLLPALRTHVWFASCPEDFQVALVERSSLLHLSAGETLFKSDEFRDGLSCVVAGALRLGSMSPHDGSHRLTLYVEPYHWFGEVSLIDRLPRAMLAVADTPSTVLVTSRVQLEAWLDEHPQHWRDVARLAGSKLRLMTVALEDSASLSLHQRLARRLLFSAVNFGQVVAPSGRRRHLRLPQEYLAQMMGVSRQTVNKALRDMERERVIALHYADLESLDLEALLARAGAIDPNLMQMFTGVAPAGGLQPLR